MEKLAQDVINDNMMSYSSYVLTQRALPDLRDGLKPVQRRIIYSMFLNNVTKLTKSATVSGKVFELHAHGDTYGSIVNLVQKDRQNIPFLEGKGSWGQFTSNRQGAAASRYTEVKLGQPALEALKELKNDAVGMIPNYDGTINIPEALPVTYPVILTNHSSGIGVGFSSDTISFNIHDLFTVVKNKLNKKQILFTDLIPDFATGGVILDNDKNLDQLEKIFNEGQGSFTMRARTKFENNKIIIYELPFGVKREQIIDKIIKLSKDKKINEVKDIRDGTSFTGMKIVITLKNNVDKEKTLEKLFMLTPMQADVSVNMNILDEGYPKVLGVNTVLDKWIIWRKQIIINTLNNKLVKNKNELHLLKGLEKILINIDEVIKIIRFSKDEDILDNLMKQFNIDITQAEYVSNIKLRNINSEKIENKIKNIKQLESDVKTLENNINNDSFINEELLSRMGESIQKMNVPLRRTTFEKIKTEEIKMVDIIDENNDYDVNIVITKNGFIFKDVTNVENKIGESDEIKNHCKINNNQSIFLFFDKSIIGQIKVKDIKTDDHINNHIAVNNNNLIGSFINDDNILLIIFEDGQAVKFEKSVFITNRNILNNAYYNKKILKIFDMNSDFDIKLKDGKTTKTINSSKINLKKSRLSKGQNIIKPKNKLQII